jgi:hypothetical protein
VKRVEGVVRNHPPNDGDQQQAVDPAGQHDDAVSRPSSSLGPAHDDLDVGEESILQIGNR